MTSSTAKGRFGCRTPLTEYQVFFSKIVPLNHAPFLNSWMMNSCFCWAGRRLEQMSRTSVANILMGPLLQAFYRKSNTGHLEQQANGDRRRSHNSVSTMKMMTSQ